MNARRHRRAGQTLILLALLGGILLVAMALVIDNGNQKRVRAETQAVCDAAALAGLAEMASTGSALKARDKAIEYCRLNGYTLTQRGVARIEAYAYDSTTNNVDVATSDRYHVKITRELAQHFMAGLGVPKTGATTMSVAALISAAPVDVNLDLDIRANLGAQIGFPDKATLSQFGPSGNYELGDPFSTPSMRGRTNPTYQPNGLRYDLHVPGDLVDFTGSSWVRVELFDPDCINDPVKSTRTSPTHPVVQLETPRDTDGDTTEPETGAVDEILGPPPGTGGGNNAANFPQRSTQTEYTLLDKNLTVIAQATYGPAVNTPFYTHLEDPRTAPIPVAPSHVDPARAQEAVDLKWVTPVGFEFDTLAHPGPYRLMVRTTAGSSENGYSLRLGTHRGAGEAFRSELHAVTGTSTLGIYARGKVVISFLDIASARFTVAAVPSGTKYLRISNFDTEVGAASLKFSMLGFDALTGQGIYPILFEGPESGGGPDVVEDQAGVHYYTELTGTRSPNAQWRNDRIDILQPQPIPRTDGSGNLVFDIGGRIEIVDERPFEGGDLQIQYRAGANGHEDTSGWQFSYYRPEFVTGEQDIILIR